MKLNLRILMFDMVTALHDACKHKRSKNAVREFMAQASTNIIQLSLVLILHLYQPLPSKCFIVFHPKQREVFAAQFSGSCGASPVLQLYTPALRGHVYTRQLFVYRGTRNAGWHNTFVLLYQTGKPELSARSIYTQVGYTWLLHAHQQAAAAGYLSGHARQDGYSPSAQGYAGRGRDDMGAGARYGLYTLAYRADSNARPEDIVHQGHAHRGMGGSGRVEIAVYHTRGLRTADRQSDITAFLKRVSEYTRPIYEARVALPLLWQVCGRFLCGEPDREWLLSLVPRVRAFLKSELGLDLHMGKVHIAKMSQGVEFLGAYILPYRILMSNDTVGRIRKKLTDMSFADLEKVERSVNSYLGIMSHTASYNLRRELFYQKKFLQIGYFDRDMTKFTLL